MKHPFHLFHPEIQSLDQVLRDVLLWLFGRYCFDLYRSVLDFLDLVVPVYLNRLISADHKINGRMD